MAEIKITLTTNEIHEAIEHWATRKILAYGKAISSEVVITQDKAGALGVVTGAHIWIDEHGGPSAKVPVTDQTTP